MSVLNLDNLFLEGMWLPMLALLILGAWCDKNGWMVPDIITIPYAIMGISVGFYYGRYITTTICLALLIFTVQSWRPKWMKQINQKLVERAYSRQEHDGDFQKEAEAMDAAAEAFAMKNHRKILNSCIAISGIAGIINLILPVVLHAIRGEVVTTANEIISATSLYVLYIALFIWLLNGHEVDEEVSAIGGADVIVFIGIFACYGFLSALICMIATLVVYLLLTLIQQLVKKEKIIGAPMLPAVALAAPVRALCALYLCPAFVEMVNNSFAILAI